MAVLLTAGLVLVAITVLLGIYQKSKNKFCTSKKRLYGKTCLVTGGTSGMGLEIAKEFARRGAKVIVACPFEDEGLIAQKLIIEETGNRQVNFKLLNLASLSSTRQFAEDILKTEDRLDLLINNAGISSAAELTQDGFVCTTQINYIGHFLLTILLLPLLKKTGTPEDKSRIVNTSSVLHRLGKYKPGDMTNTDSGAHVFLYNDTKLYLAMFTYELAQRLKRENVVVYCIDPGAVGTSIFIKSFGNIVGRFFQISFYLLTKTPWEGIQTALHVSLDERLGDVSGEFFINCTLSRAREECYNRYLTKQLWDETVRLLKLEKSEIDACVR